MKKLGSIILMAFVAALLVGALYTLQWMRTPLDAPLELTLPAQSQPEAPAAQAQTATPAAQEAAPAAQGSQKTCGESGSMALLVSGVSMPEWRPVHGVGALRLVKVDFDRKTVEVLNVPRALFVENTNLQTPDEMELTVVYRLARDAAKGNNPGEINRKATQDMAQVLVDDFGYLPDHYITVDPAKFVDMVDTLGGIDINLPNKVDGTPDYLESFPSGDQHLDGGRTLDLLRIIHPADGPAPTVWNKFERQRLVTMALLTAMLQPSNWDKLPQVTKDARQVVVTDLSVNQALDLLCMVKQAGEGTNFQDVSSNLVQQVSDEEVRMLDPGGVKALIQEYSSDKK